MTAPRTEQHPSEEAVRWLERLEQQQRELDAGRLSLLAAAMREALGEGAGRGRELAYRSLRAELALALNLSERQAEAQLDLAHRVSEQYAASLEALGRGEIACAHLRVIVDAGLVVGAGDDPGTAERRAGYEREVLDVAVRETPNRLRPLARRVAEQWAARPLEERHAEAASRRRVCVVEGEDGMADLVATLPAMQAYAIHDRLTRIARAVERGERAAPAAEAPGGTEAGPSAAEAGAASAPAAGAGSDPGAGAGSDPGSVAGSDPGAGASRSRDQLRADVFADLLLCADERVMFAGSPGEAIRARVQVTVPGGTLTMDASAIPLAGAAPVGPLPGEGLVCELAGYGPVEPGFARDLAARAAHWDTTRTDDTGGVLGVERYRPSEQMRRLLSARDEHCRFPGCRVPASRCDLDHTVDAARGGPTSIDNLAHLCRGHHTLKHHGGWAVEQHPGGVLAWLSPTGRTHIDRPPGGTERGKSLERSSSSDRAGPPGRRSGVRFTRPEQPEVCF